MIQCQHLRGGKALTGWLCFLWLEPEPGLNEERMAHMRKVQSAFP